MLRMGRRAGFVAPLLAALALSAPATPVVPPLSGVTIVLDPGHQLGNHNYPQQISRLVPAGGFRKPCNTTGTATNAGYPEATFAWQVALLVRDRLRALGARVVMTRTANRQDLWGPCVDVRGRAGNALPADLKLSIHADGHRGGHGFHVIAPTDRAPWTHDIYRPSRSLALAVRAALHTSLPYATYTAGGDGLDFRSDLGTLNLADIPTAMVELGNMRDAGDARRMTSYAGRAAYAQALVRGMRSWLGR
jgi:N-acetylmuramoyl-L-alanine amidase